jgi:hypothetical protein
VKVWFHLILLLFIIFRNNKKQKSRAIPVVHSGWSRRVTENGKAIRRSERAPRL